MVNAVAVGDCRVVHTNARKPIPQCGMNVRQFSEISRRAVRASRNLLLISGRVAGANARKPTPQAGWASLYLYLTVCGYLPQKDRK